MANFQPTAYKKIEANEGYWAHDPDDTGGETWKGIARNKNPNWAGWRIIDDLKRQNPKSVKLAYAGERKLLNAVLSSSKELEILVVSFYEANYWDINRLDEIKDQQLADNVCDCGVNCGTKMAAKMLQIAYNSLKPISGPIAEDGQIGPATIRAVNFFSAEQLYFQYNSLRKVYYDSLIAKKPVYEKYRKSWYSRIVPYKK